MTTTAEPELDITEITEMDVDLVNGVGQPANGAPHLLLKGLGDVAKADAAKADMVDVGEDAGGNDYRHDPIIGPHEHAHPAFGAGDGDDCDMHAHSHEHGRDGHPDAVHDHAHAAAKAVVNGKVDQRPDIKIADQVLALLGQAMGNESDEVSAGRHDEVHDVDLLTQAHRLVQRWRNHEVRPDGGADGYGVVIDSAWSYPPDDLAKEHREFSADERKKQADSGNALPDGSYPIPDKDALRRAAILARSKHGNWQAARRLIARRAKELGVPNPLDDDKGDGDGKAGKSALIGPQFLAGLQGTVRQAILRYGEASKSAVVADEGADVDTTTQGSEIFTIMAKTLADAVTEAVGPLGKQIEKLSAESTSQKELLGKLDADMAKVKATPIPGGPVLSAAAAARPQAQADGEDHAAKSVYYAQMAETVTDRASADGYRILARQHAEKARSAAPASST